MPRWKSLLLGLTFAIASPPPGFSESVEITLAIPSPGEATVDVTLIWWADGDVSDEDVPTKQVSVTTPWQGELPLDPARVWRIQAQADGYWSSLLSWRSGQVPHLAVLLQPATQAHGKVWQEVTEGTSLLDEIQAWVNLNEGDQTRPRWHPLDCTLTDLRFSCDVPMGLLDLKFSIPGYVPVYKWGLSATDEPLDLGDIQLLLGGSLSGWVIATGGPPEAPIELSLLPRTLGAQQDSREVRRTNLKALRTSPNERGFFTIGPIPAGGFDLLATKAGLAPQRIEALDFTAAEERILDQVIELVEPPPLEVHLTPPVSPDQQPWQVVLMRPRSNSNTLKTVNRSAAGFDGHWHLDAVPSGTYRLEVRDFRDATWMVRNLELDQIREPLFYELDSVAIEGTLTSNDEPLDGTVVFGTRQRRPNVALAATEGTFAGVLPRAGIWKVEVERKGATNPYTVEVDDVTVEQGAGGSPAKVDIELPETLLEGEVRHRGKPAAEAFVTVFAEEEPGAPRRRVASIRADEDGKFSVRGLQPVPVQVAAYLGAFDPASDWLHVDISDGTDSPYLEIELLDKVEYQAKIMGPQGPVAGAQVFVETLDSKSMSWPAQAISASDGVARFQLPANSLGKPTRLMVLAAGYGFTIQQRRLSEGGEITLWVSPDRGDLHLPYPLGTLHTGGASVPVSKILTTLISANRMAPQAGDGVVLKGIAAGEYLQCPDNGKEQDCVGGVLTPSSTLRLDVVDSDFLEEAP